MECSPVSKQSLRLGTHYMIILPDFTHDLGKVCTGSLRSAQNPTLVSQANKFTCLEPSLDAGVQCQLTLQTHVANSQ